MKIDLIMWTLNGSKTLPVCLRSIESAVPGDVVGQKIVVDGGSCDGSRDICERFGWNVVDCERRGIGFQANEALGLVETEFVASFEQDIILNPCWFRRVMSVFMDEKVAVAQGVRLCLSPTVRFIEEFALSNQKIYTSLDNTVYRTKVIKSLNGFNNDLPFACDRDLYHRVLSNGFKWVVDRGLVSGHNKNSFVGYCNKVRKDVSILKYATGYTSFRDVVLCSLFSPVRGLDMALRFRRPELLLAYPFLRLQHVLGYVKNENRSLK